MEVHKSFIKDVAKREKGEKLASVQETLPMKVKAANQVALTL